MAFGSNQFGAPFFGEPTVDSGASIQLGFFASRTVVHPLADIGGPPRVSQVAVETLYAAPANARASQLAIEVVRQSATNAGVSQVAVEVLYPARRTIQLGFFASRTHIYSIFSVFDPNFVGFGAGNGGESFALNLAPGGSTFAATLVSGVSAVTGTLHLSGYGDLPVGIPIVLVVDGEQIYGTLGTGGAFSVSARGTGNTTAISHSAGASVTWSDTYDMALAVGSDIASSFSADINSTGLTSYPGWLICFDSSQAYLGGSRYPFHVTELVGVFAAGAGTSGLSRLDGPQPNAVCTAVGVSDDCPAALSNPARVQTDIVIGDVAVVRYANPEGVTLGLGPRSAALQSWFGLKRVDDTDNDVTFTDPNPPDSSGHGAHVVDTIPGVGPYTGSVNGEWFNPSGIGIAPDTGLPTPNPCPYTTVTLPGVDRYFTFGAPHYSEKGWPMCCLAVRHDNRRIPFWRSFDWRDYSFVYSGWQPDATYAQILINRNGITGALPTVTLPGSQDIAGPDAVWDDGSYHFGASWYVVIFSTPYLVAGPVIGGAPGPALGSGGGTPAGGYVPIVDFPSGSPPVVTQPPVEGGSGGGITPPGGLFAWVRS